MPSLIPYHLSFRGGFRVGTRGVNLEEAGPKLPSDTLFSALVDAARRSGEDAGAFVERFRDDPPCLLTSGFPRAGSLRFYPLPLSLIGSLPESVRQRRGKKLKAVRYISEGVLILLLQGRPPSDLLFPERPEDAPTTGAALQNGEFWMLVGEVDKLPAAMQFRGDKARALVRQQVWSKTNVNRVTVSRITQQSQIYVVGRVSFAPECGLWFGLAVREQGIQRQLDSLLARLQDDGLGGERTSGYGTFLMERQAAIMLPDGVPSGLSMLLSRYHPNDEEISVALAHQDAAYELVSVAGWLRSPDGAPQRRKEVVMLEAGSVVALPHAPAGQIVDVTPEFDNPTGALPHRVYRNGYGLAIAWPSGAKGAAR